MVQSALQFVGRLHPLIVHLPIGIVLFAFALIILKKIKSLELDAAINYALLFGAISATLACIAGYILAQSGEYKIDLVFKHQWLGIATAGLSFAAYFIKKFQFSLTTLTVLVLAIAAHYGGSLTHGVDYLFPSDKQSANLIASKKQDSRAWSLNNTIGWNKYPHYEGDISKGSIDSITNIKAQFQKNKKTVQNQQKPLRLLVTYSDDIAPILENKCYKCHSETKQKGGLRLDSETYIQEGGKHGSILTVGDAENSKLYSYLLLPEDDDNHMPPKGKPQLSEQEVITIHDWIQTSNHQIATSSQLPTNQQVKPKSDRQDVSKNLVGANSYSPLQNLQGLTETEILKNKVIEASSNDIEFLKNENIIISNFGSSSNYLMANFINVKNYSSNLLDDLTKIKSQLVRLRLGNQPVVDNDIKKISGFKNLTWLNLEKTSITDVSLSYLKNLPNLEQLNLYGNNITDGAIDNLVKCPNLKVVYLWQTKITAAGIQELKNAAPNLQIETGNY